MPVLEIIDLKKSFRSPKASSQAVIDIPSLSIEAGEQLALRGYSGTGKTTFLNLIAGILKADSGQIIIDGSNMTQLRESARDKIRGRHIGYVFQTFNLLQGYSALENVLLAMAFGSGVVDRDKAVAMLKRVGLENRLDYRPREMSVGQQQRVAVARAMVNHPKIVLADEPTGNLDRQNALVAIEMIREICRENKAALLLVSHDEHVLGLFDQVRDMAQINQANQANQVIGQQAS